MANERCPDCTFLRTHAASCPTQLRTLAQRIERAAHLYASFDAEVAQATCERDGVAEGEQRAGAAVAEMRRMERETQTALLGDPAYGGWTPRDRLPQRRAAGPATAAIGNGLYARVGDGKSSKKGRVA